MAHDMLLTQQLELGLGSESLALTKAQVACLNAIARGSRSKSQIAITARLDLPEALRAVDALAKLQLIRRTANRHWQITRRGRNCQFRTLPDKKRRDSNKLGRAAQRLLAALSRPMTGDEHARHLLITKQRVRYLVVKLHAMGQLRVGDHESVLHIIVRRDDPAPLLSRHEQRVFSAAAEQYATTAAKIKLAAGCNKDVAERALQRLVAIGLVAENKKANGSKRYQITKAGSLHPQYRQAAGRADPPPLPVRSDRVLAVLSLLAERGHARITEVRDALRVPHPSINALFQYLKRKSLVRKEAKDLLSPYTLTDEGLEALTELKRRRAA
jgi:predicted transcriptional regulator